MVNKKLRIMPLRDVFTSCNCATSYILWWWHNCECLRVIFYYLIVRVCVSRRYEDRIHIGDSIVILRDFPYINSLPDIVYLTLNNELLNKNT